MAIDSIPTNNDDPPKWKETLRSRIEKPFNDGDWNRSEARRGESKLSGPRQLVVLSQCNGSTEFFHDKTGTPFAKVPYNGRWKVLMIRSPEFEAWLSGLAFDAEELAPDRSMMERAICTIAVLSARGENREVFLRHGTDGEAFYYDLCNEAGEVVKITADGWKITTDCPVMFYQEDHMLPQVTPKGGKPGSLEKIIDLANLSPECLDVLSVHIPTLCIPQISLMGGVTLGPQGSGKTTTQVLVSRLCDPTVDEKASLPSKIADLGLHLSTHRIAFFDNVTHLTGEQSDMLSRATTGGTDTGRALYTNNGTNRRTYKAPTFLNAITLTGAKPDFFDRVITYSTQDDFGNGPISDKKLEKAIADLLPHALGEIFDLLAGAMMYHEGSREEIPGWVPRMADWYLWALDVAKAMGHPDGWFEGKLKPMLEQRNYDAIAEDPVTTVLEYVAKKGGFVGTAQELFSWIDDKERDLPALAGIDSRGKTWPDNAQALGQKITRIIKPLTSHGVFITRRLWKDVKPHRTVLKSLQWVKVHGPGGAEPYGRSERIIIISDHKIEIDS